MFEKLFYTVSITDVSTEEVSVANISVSGISTADTSSPDVSADELKDFTIRETNHLDDIIFKTKGLQWHNYVVPSISFQTFLYRHLKLL